MTWRRAAAFLVLVSCLAQSSSSAPPRVSFLKPIPRIVSSQDAVSFKVRIEPDPSARLLIVAALDVGGEVVRRSDEQLDRHSPRTRWVYWRGGLPAGDLLILAEVWDNQKPLGRASTPLCVTSRLGELCPSLVVEP
jgi:hypothetical protein